MTVNQVQLSLIGIFLGAFAIQLVSFFRISQYVWPEDLQALVLKLLAIYSVHLGVIVGGIFAQSRARAPKPSLVAATTAILLAVIWNLLLVGRTMSFAMARQGSTTELIKYLETVSDYGSFLVVGALAFFFGKAGAKPTAGFPDPRGAVPSARRRQPRHEDVER